MPAGGPGDHWQSDLLTFGIEAFGGPVDSVIRDIIQMGGYRLFDDHASLGRQHWALWHSSTVGGKIPESLESDLRNVSDGLSRAAEERVWEMPAADDLFERLRRLEKSLGSNGRGDVALQLADAIAAGATGTEILMHARYVLQVDMARESPLDPSLASQIKAVLAEIDTTLSQGTSPRRGTPDQEAGALS